jgi:ketosteroid isomerase-like protein
MEKSHPNAERVRELFAAFRAGDVSAISSVLADDVVWRFPGRIGKIAGEHRGRDGVFAFLGNVMQLTEGTFSLELEHVVADDTYAVAFFTGTARREGKRLENPTCLKMRLEAGKVVDIREFVWNLYEVDEFWS